MTTTSDSGFPARRGSVLPMVAVMLLVLGLVGCRQAENEVAVNMDEVKADLKIVSTARIFFGHQSVGRNILAGIESLTREAGIALNIVEIPVGSSPGSGPGLYHATVGVNQAPERKVDDFVASLRAADGASYDVAMLKFCYVDLDEGSAPDAEEKIFSRYEGAMRELRTQSPNTSLLHATMPIMSDPPGWKTGLKRLIGKATWRDEANIRRFAYNQRVRAQYPTSELLDLARVESTRADGTPVTFSAGGKKIESMALEYTNDGGHLSEAGQRRVAAAFLHAVAMAVQRNSNAAPAAGATTTLQAPSVAN